mgnify:CR=1 FL=1
MTSRGPLTLAALASAAVPGLDPTSVEGVVGTGPARPYDVAFVQDHEHRRWVIRCPRTPAASAGLEQSAALLALLSRRLTMPVPAVKGWVPLPEGGRGAVSAYLTGRRVELASIAPGSALASGLGRALAQLHNLDRRIFEEAGVPVYEAEAYRTRRLAELDRAAAMGRVPTGLLTRWERTLEDLSLWRFTTTPTHGAIAGGTVLATPDDGEEPEIKGFLGWESAQVADPAERIKAIYACTQGAKEMAKALTGARPELGEYAPRIETMQIAVDKIREVIGSGGKVIRSIVEESGAKVDINDDGTIKIAANDQDKIDAAKTWIQSIASEPEVGTIYSGKVVKVVDFGAFVNFFGKRDGLVHVSQISNERVSHPKDIVAEGQSVKVKLMGFDERGKVKLSMKRVNQETGEEIAEPRREEAQAE